MPSVHVFSKLSLSVDLRQVARLHHFFETTVDAMGSRIALEHGDQRWTYQELDAQANRLAHYLIRRGAGPGTRMGILLYRSVETYVALLAILKAGAAFVPIDPGTPSERLQFLANDSGLYALLTSAVLAEKARNTDVNVVELDTEAAVIAAMPSHRPPTEPGAADATCYIIYTSGSSGRPKGVEVSHASICNFLTVVPGLYDVRPSDRVYQGMTISFDFSIEEIWPTWAVGATLVVGPGDSRRFGSELAEFLEESGVTVLYCVPTLLATIPHELPGIRNLLVGGEACPAELVDRWSRPGRRMLNTYGPTEATVTATWSELVAGKPVTIGRALPTYSTVILDDQHNPVPDGQVGEICIGGPGVAKGYIGRPDLTAEKFIEHPSVPPGSRLYRTGDLGRVTENGEIEYLGRADAEVKIRGHRVDLGEIEGVLLEDDSVASAVAAMVPTSTTTSELAAYITCASPGGRNDGESQEALLGRLHDQLRLRLPEYMRPAYLDVVTALPMMPSGKVDRSRLPAPIQRRRNSADSIVPPATPMEERVRAVWVQAFGLKPEEISVEADFFSDLDGHSLLAATVVSLLREGGVGASPTVRDLYAHPTIRLLAACLTEPAAPTGSTAEPTPAPVRHRTRRLAIAGLAQLGFILALFLLISLPIAVVYSRNDGQVSLLVLSELAVAAVVAYALIRWVLPPILVRFLTAGIRPGRYRLWGPTYVRLWASDIILAFSPLPLLSGSPLMSRYLRLLGARVGRRSHIATSVVSLPRQMKIGSDVSIGYGTHLRPWLVRDGWLVVAPITVENNAYVGADSVLEPGSVLEEDAMLLEHSAVAANQRIPAGQCWSGSPSKACSTLDRMVEDMGALPTPAGWGFMQLMEAAAGIALFELLLLVMMAPGVAMVWWSLLTWGVLAGLLAAILVGPVFVLTVCLVLALTKRLLPRIPAGVHMQRSALGVRKWLTDKIFETSLTLTNSLYATLYTNGWLRLLGARVGRGAEVATAAYLDANLLTLREGSFVADMASVGSAKFYNGYVAMFPTEVGERAFVGNAATMPTGTTLGENSLIGAHTMPSSDGTPSGTSWLGSPAMYLPQRQYSGDFPEHLTFRPRRATVLQRLAIEFCRATLPATLISVSIYLYLLVLSQVTENASTLLTVLFAPLLAVASGLAVVVFVAGLKWLIIGGYQPRVEPLWSGFVRRAEFITGLYEAAAVPALLNFLVGTPMLRPMLRLFGVHIGRRTWIATTYVTEFDLVEIGDDAMVGHAVSLQTHLFEDRIMKMARVRVGAGATVGDRSIVLYDGFVGPDATLGPLSLVMKGEHLPASTHWQGIPAQGAA